MGKLSTAYTSTQPVPELQDRVFGLSATTKALVENKLEVANRINNIYDEIDQLDKRIFAVAYAEGERILKFYKKTTAWNSFPREEKISQFIELSLIHISDLSSPAKQNLQREEMGTPSDS